MRRRNEERGGERRNKDGEGGNQLWTWTEVRGKRDE